MIDFLQNYYFLLLLPVIPVPLVKRKGFGRYLKDKWIYYTIVAIWIVGIFVLHKSPSFLSPTDPKAARNVYYFLILIGAGIATFISVWRGRQSEKQIDQSDQQIDQFERQARSSYLEGQNARFEKALDMATDPTSRARRWSGFQILRQLPSAWRENFDDSTKERIDILTYLVLNKFEMTLDTRKYFRELYEGSKVRYSEEEYKLTELLYGKTHRPDIDNVALNLWKDIVSWNRRKFDLNPVVGIFAGQASHFKAHFFIFSGIDLSGINFLVGFHSEKIDFPTQDMCINFSNCCFLHTQMKEATVNHVDFSKSHLSFINSINDEADCNMKCIGTIFDEANLIRCNFKGADFKDASFLGTNISGSDFRRAKNLTPEQFQKGAYWIKPANPCFPSNFPLDFANTLPNQAPLQSQKW